MRAFWLVWFVVIVSAFLGQAEEVRSIKALEDTVKAAMPGELVTLKDGVYGQAANLQAQGQPGKPVTVRAATLGGVVFTKPVTLNGSWLTLEGVAFRGCRGELTLRHGHRNVVAQNFFFGDGEKGSGGVRLQGRDQVVVNNSFHGLGKAAIAMMDGTPDKLYMPVKRARILHNTVIDCGLAMAIGLNHSKHPNGTAPAECLIAGNAFFSSDRRADLIQYVQDDMPKKWLWEGNYFHGLLGIPAVEGLSEASLGFVSDGDKIARSTAKTPTVKRDLEDASMWLDAFGIERREKTAVGAIELSDQKPKYGPLRANQVGPGA